MSRFEELELLWETNGGCASVGSEEDSTRKVEGLALLSELLFFQHTTGDNRFAGAISALIECGAMDPHGRWRRGWISQTDFEALTAKVDFFEDLLRRGFSRRQAAAEVAARSPVRANSFDAAIKQVQRMADRVGQSRREKKSNDIG